MTFPLVRDIAAVGILVTCGVLGFSPQTFHKWRARRCPDRDWDDAHLIKAIIDGHDDDLGFGYRFIADELEHLDPRARRIVATHLASVTKAGRPAQVIVTTYEHAIARQLAEDLPGTYISHMNRTEAPDAT